MGFLWAAALCGAASTHAPRLQFDQVIHDYGKTSQVAFVSGIFKYRNVGNDVLKIEPPKPSCGCTVAELKPDTLKPGESGELAYTLHLGPIRAKLEKHIAVRSNDPSTPEVTLVIKADYTPLYELNPLTISPSLMFGADVADQSTVLTRTDGKPLRIARLDASKPWITATAGVPAKGEEATSRIRVAVRRDGTPRRFNEYVQVYTLDDTNTPAASIYVYGQMMGQVSLSPEALYWSITDSNPAASARPEESILRRVTIRSADGAGLVLKNPKSSIKGIKVELVPKEAGKVYELLARLDEVPASTLSGSVSFETSVAAQERIELPIIVNVFKP